MSARSSSPSSYEFERRLFDLALQNPGMKFRVDSPGKATNIITRLNRLRKLLRDAEQKRLDSIISGEAANTAYDKFIIKQQDADGNSDRKNGCYVVFDVMTYGEFEILDADGNPIQLLEDEKDKTSTVYSGSFLEGLDIVDGV